MTVIIPYEKYKRQCNRKIIFDRLLIHAAIRHGLILISQDDSFGDYQEFGLKLLP